MFTWTGDANAEVVMERMVLLLSDYQLLFGTAMLVAGLWKHCSISVYHFTIVIQLSWFSNTHMTSLSVLKCYLQERPTLRNWRVCIMVFMLIMMLVALVLTSTPLWGANARLVVTKLIMFCLGLGLYAHLGMFNTRMFCPRAMNGCPHKVKLTR